MRPLRPFLAAVPILATIAAVAPAPPDPPPPRPADLTARSLRYDADRRVWIARGDVRLRFRAPQEPETNWIGRGDYAIFRQEPDEIELSGIVTLEGEGLWVAADRMRWFPATGVGELERVRIRIDSEPEGELFLLADRVLLFTETDVETGVQRRIVTAERPLVTTCSFAEPDYHLRPGRVTFERVEPIVPDGTDDAETRPRRFLHMEPSWWTVGRIPLLPLPGFRRDLDKPSLLREVGAGSTTEFGRFGHTRWGIPFDNRDSEAVANTPWLDEIEFLYDLDGYERRGIGHGLTIPYAGPGYEGRIDGYTLHDKIRDPLLHDFNPRYRDRWRARLFQRHHLPDSWRLDLEGHRLSDASFRETYFEEEFETGRPVENRILLTRPAPFQSLSLLARSRGNRFLEQVDYLPRVRWETFSMPVVPVGTTDLLYTSRWEAANIRKNDADPDRRTDAPSERTWRLDTDQRFSLPLAAGPVFLEPYVGTRQTWWHETPPRDAQEIRGAALFGGTVSSRLFRIYDVESPGLGLDGLKHVVIPRAVATSVQEPTTVRNLPSLDEFDALGATDTWDLSLQNLLVTRRGPDREKRTWADVTIASTLYTNPRRDNLGESRHRDGESTPRAWSDVTGDLLWTPHPALAITSDARYDTYRRRWEENSAGILINPSSELTDVNTSGRARVSGGSAGYADGSAGDDRIPLPWDLSLGIEQRAAREEHSTTSGVVEATLSERWSIRYEFEWEWKWDLRLRDWTITVRRNGHDFVFLFTADHDSFDDVQTYRLDVLPRAFRF